MYIPKKDRIEDELKDCECGKCGIKITRYNRHGKERRFVSGHNMVGKRAHNYIGRKKRKKNGKTYWLIHKPDHPHASKRGYVYEHRLVWEEYYNCCLLKKAAIHHKDENPENNDISNLMALPSHIEHMRLHLTGKVLRKVDYTGRSCVICGSTTTYIKKNGRPQWETFNGKDSSEGYVCSICGSKRYHRKKKK